MHYTYHDVQVLRALINTVCALRGRAAPAELRFSYSTAIRLAHIRTIYVYVRTAAAATVDHVTTYSLQPLESTISRLMPDYIADNRAGASYLISPTN